MNSESLLPTLSLFDDACVTKRRLIASHTTLPAFPSPSAFRVRSWQFVHATRQFCHETERFCSDLFSFCFLAGDRWKGNISTFSTNTTPIDARSASADGRLRVWPRRGRLSLSRGESPLTFSAVSRFVFHWPAPSSFLKSRGLDGERGSGLCRRRCAFLVHSSLCPFVGL